MPEVVRTWPKMNLELVIHVVCLFTLCLGPKLTGGYLQFQSPKIINPQYT